MACNVPIIVMSDNYKASEYIREVANAGVIAEPNIESIKSKTEFIIHNQMQQGRLYVLENWTHKHYAKEIEKWLES